MKISQDIPVNSMECVHVLGVLVCMKGKPYSAKFLREKFFAYYVTCRCECVAKQLKQSTSLQSKSSFTGKVLVSFCPILTIRAKFH